MGVIRTKRNTTFVLWTLLYVFATPGRGVRRDPRGELGVVDAHIAHVRNEAVEGEQVVPHRRVVLKVTLEGPDVVVVRGGVELLE